MNLLDHTSDLCKKLSSATQLGQANLKSAQRRMKVWYDRKAWQQIFRPGDKVLILFPTPGHTLQARYCGPYLIEKKLNEVDYVVQMPERRKQRRVCHIIMLKEYYEDGLSHSVADRPLAVGTTVNVAHVNKPMEKWEGPTDVGADVRQSFSACSQPPSEDVAISVGLTNMDTIYSHGSLRCIRNKLMFYHPKPGTV